MEIRAFKVSKIVEYTRDLLENDMLLCSLWLEGEISNFTHHSSGHMFFSLKDDKAALRCVIFKSDADELPFAPKNGDFVRMYGRMTLYSKNGDMRFVGEFMTLSGQGIIKQDLEQLKEKLREEGVFENRRPLPRYPQKIAIVTSPTGAAIADMLKVIKAKNAAVKIVLVSALVQGENAPASIVKAIEVANLQTNADVLIVGRGGGSAEDLWAFNDESVARAVFASKIPVVSAVGHETDFSLCDFAADLRCATPTEAAQTVTPSLDDMLQILDMLTMEIKSMLSKRLQNDQSRLSMRQSALMDAVSARLQIAKHDLLTKSQILEKISPMAVLRRGFALVEDTGGVVVRSGADLKQGQHVVLQFNDTKKEAEIL